MKRLKNSEEQLKIIGNKTDINSYFDLFDENLTSEVKIIFWFIW